MVGQTAKEDYLLRADGLSANGSGQVVFFGLSTRSLI
jgi:hypothetical protein